MGDYTAAAMMGLNLLQSSQQNKATMSADAAQQRADIQQRRYQLQIQERDKRDRLKRAVSTQRSRFGAQGLNPASGSAAALIEGLRKDTEKSISNQRSMETMRINNLIDNSQHRANNSLLEYRNKQINKGLKLSFNLLEQ